VGVSLFVTLSEHIGMHIPPYHLPLCPSPSTVLMYSVKFREVPVRYVCCVMYNVMCSTRVDRQASKPCTSMQTCKMGVFGSSSSEQRLYVLNVDMHTDIHTGAFVHTQMHVGVSVTPTCINLHMCLS